MSAIQEGITLVSVADTVTVKLTPGTEWAAAERDWSELSKLSPYCSYFVGPDWIGPWIETYRQCLNIEILRFFDGSRIVGACLLVWRKRRRGPVWFRMVYLNASGEDEWEEAGTEFNDLLCLAGYEEQVAAALRNHLDSRAWDEFVINGCRQSASIRVLGQAFAGQEEVRSSVRSYYVDLNAIREDGDALEMSLSANTRRHLRQNLRAYEQHGELRYEQARSIEEATAMLNELIGLHQARWNQKRRPGAFASPRFREFHRRILSRSFDRGQVDLIRVSAGREVIGFLYNYLADDKVYSYQSGYRYTDRRLSPGTVTLFVAIRSYLACGSTEFDFMAGDVSYKKSFSGRFRQLDSVTVRRSTWRNSVMDFLRNSRTRLRR